MSHDLKVNYGVLDSARATLEKNRVEQIEKFYPNLVCTQSLGHMAITSERLHKQSVIIKQICKLFPQRRVNLEGGRKDGSSGQYDLICNARLPRGLDPHSVPAEELAASLGNMVQLLNLVVRNMAVPALHNSGFAFHFRGLAREYGNEILIGMHALLLEDRSSSNFGVTSMDSERRFLLDSSGSSFDHSSASLHTAKAHKDLQKGISLLKKSVSCITSYCYNSLCLDVPAEASTKDVRSVFSLKMACLRSGKQDQQLNKSVWSVNSAMSSSGLLESAQMLPLTKIFPDNNLCSSTSSFLFATEMSDSRKNENPIDEWNLVDHPTFPPPPSETKDVEHWTRAMFVDATKR